MKRLNKKGFTLVELLAVIVVLALLMVVAASSIGNALNNAKKNTLKTEAQKFVTTAYQDAYSQYMLNGTLPTGSDWTAITPTSPSGAPTVYKYEKTDGDYVGIVMFNASAEVIEYCVNYNLKSQTVSGAVQYKADLVIGETYASAVASAPSVSKTIDVTEKKYCNVVTTTGKLKWDNVNQY